MHYRRANALMLAIASNRSTPQKVLEELSKEQDPHLLEQIAENENSHPRTLEYLSSHPLHSVRVALTQNLRLPAEIVWKLHADAHPDVRYSLACNPQIALDVLIALREDENPFVSTRAEQTIQRVSADRQDLEQQASTLVDVSRRTWRRQKNDQAV